MIVPNAGVVLALASGLTGMLRRSALAPDVFDVLKERSLCVHSAVRGGSVAIVMAFSQGVLGLGITGLINATTSTSVVVAGIIAAVIVFLDGPSALPEHWRLLAHS